MDIHRQAIVNDDRIRNSLNGIRHSKPNDSVGVVITGFSCFQLCGRISAVLCDIGCCRIRALCNRPAAGAVGVNPNIVSGTVIIQRIALRQNTGCKNFGLYIRCVVQKHLAVNDRVGHGHLVGKGAGQAGGLVYDDLAVFIHKIEGIAYIGALPCKHGGYGVLFGFITQPVGVVQCGALIGRIGARLALTLHGTGQIDIVTQCQLRLVDGAHLPVEGLRRKIIIIRSISVGINGNRIAGGVIPEGIGADHAVNENIAALLIGVGLGAICVKCHRLQHCGSAFPLADFGFCNVVRLCVDVICLNDDLRRNGFCCSITQRIGRGFHLQIIVGAHGIHEAGIGGRISDFIANGGKSGAKLLRRVNLIVIRGRTGLLRGNTLNNFHHGFLFRSTVIIGAERNREHRSAQAGNRVHILIVGGLCCVHSLKACQVFTDDCILLVRRTLDGFCHTMLVNAVYLIIVVLIGAFCIHTICNSALQPVVPLLLGIGLKIVILVRSTVRQENHIQITLFACLGIANLSRMAQLINHIKGIVIVGAGLIIQVVSFGQIFSRNECSSFDCFGAGIDIVGGISACIITPLGQLIRIIPTIRAALIGIETVEVSNGNVDIKHLAVITGRLKLSDQILQRFFQNHITAHMLSTLDVFAGRAALSTVLFAANTPVFYRRRSIQHNDNVCALLHGHAGGGQLHLGNTAGLEVDAFAGFAHADRTFVGVFGVVITGNIDNTQRKAPGSLTAVSDSQILVGSVCFNIQIAAEHANSNIDILTSAIDISNRHGCAGLHMCTGTACHFGFGFIQCNGSNSLGDHVDSHIYADRIFQIFTVCLRQGSGDGRGTIADTGHYAATYGSNSAVAGGPADGIGGGFFATNSNDRRILECVFCTDGVTGGANS